VRVLLFLLLFVSQVQAQQILGLDYLGGAKYCDEILKAHPSGYAAGFFYDTFGDSTVCIDKLAASGKASAFRVQLSWSDTHQFATRDFDAIAAKAGKIDQLARKYPRIKFYVSGACEHNFHRADAELLKRKVSGRCPSCAGYVNTVWKGALIDGINEVHGKRAAIAGDYFYSTDGEALIDLDADKLRQTHGRAKLYFGWAPRFNLRQQGTTAKPKERTAKPSIEYIQSIVRAIQPIGVVPKFPFAVTKLKDKQLWKTHAEDKFGANDARANKPLFISKSKTLTLKLIASNGKEVGSIKYYGSYTDPGYHRHYSGSVSPAYGYQIAEKAKQISGSEFIVIRDGRTNYGPINPAFRAGYFR